MADRGAELNASLCAHCGQLKAAFGSAENAEKDALPWDKYLDELDDLLSLLSGFKARFKEGVRFERRSSNYMATKDRTWPEPSPDITGAERRALGRPLQATASGTASSSKLDALERKGKKQDTTEEGGGAQYEQLDENQGREAKQTTSRSVEGCKKASQCTDTKVEPFLKLEERPSTTGSGEQSSPALPAAKEERSGQESADSSCDSCGSEPSGTTVTENERSGELSRQEQREVVWDFRDVNAVVFGLGLGFLTFFVVTMSSWLERRRMTQRRQ